jgi:hypothetical protein
MISGGGGPAAPKESAGTVASLAELELDFAMSAGACKEDALFNAAADLGSHMAVPEGFTLQAVMTHLVSALRDARTLVLGARYTEPVLPRANMFAVHVQGGDKTVGVSGTDSLGRKEACSLRLAPLRKSSDPEAGPPPYSWGGDLEGDFHRSVAFPTLQAAANAMARTTVPQHAEPLAHVDVLDATMLHGHEAKALQAANARLYRFMQTREAQHRLGARMFPARFAHVLPCLPAVMFLCVTREALLNGEARPPAPRRRGPRPGPAVYLCCFHDMSQMWAVMDPSPFASWVVLSRSLPLVLACVL